MANWYIYWDDAAVPAGEGYANLNCLYREERLTVSWELRQVDGGVAYSGVQLLPVSVATELGTGVYSGPHDLVVDVETPTILELWAKPAVWDLTDAECFDDSGEQVMYVGGKYYVNDDGSLAELDENGFAFIELVQRYQVHYFPYIMKNSPGL